MPTCCEGQIALGLTSQGVNKGIGRVDGQMRAMCLRNHESEPVHPTGRASTLALSCGVSASNFRARGSNGSQLVALVSRGI